MSHSLTCSRPYSAARSRGVSCWLFLMVGSVSSWSSTETTSECPYWAAQWSAVSFSWFCGRAKGERDRQQEGWEEEDWRGGKSGCRNYGIKWAEKRGWKDAVTHNYKYKKWNMSQQRLRWWVRGRASEGDEMDMGGCGGSNVNLFYQKSDNEKLHLCRRHMSGPVHHPTCTNWKITPGL